MWKAAVYCFFQNLDGDFDRGYFAFQVMHFLTDLPRENMIEFKWFIMQLIKPFNVSDTGMYFVYFYSPQDWVNYIWIVVSGWYIFWKIECVCNLAKCLEKTSATAALSERITSFSIIIGFFLEPDFSEKKGLSVFQKLELLKWGASNVLKYSRRALFLILTHLLHCLR